MTPNSRLHDAYDIADGSIWTRRRNALLAGIFSVKVVIAEPHVLFRIRLINLLKDQHDMEVVAATGNGREAVILARDFQPDVVVMDISTPELNGIEATRQIRAACPETGVVLLVVPSTPEHICNALRAGALGLVWKELAGSEVAVAVRSAAEGRRYLSRKLINILPDVLEAY